MNYFTAADFKCLGIRNKLHCWLLFFFPRSWASGAEAHFLFFLHMGLCQWSPAQCRAEQSQAVPLCKAFSVSSLPVPLMSPFLWVSASDHFKVLEKEKPGNTGQFYTVWCSVSLCKTAPALNVSLACSLSTTAASWTRVLDDSHGLIVTTDNPWLWEVSFQHRLLVIPMELVPALNSQLLHLQAVTHLRRLQWLPLPG